MPNKKPKKKLGTAKGTRSQLEAMGYLDDYTVGGKKKKKAAKKKGKK